MEGDPFLIALHSVKGAGKDTTYGFIQEWCERSKPALSAVKRGFADKAKWAYARQFFPTISEEDAIKWVDALKDTDAKIIFPSFDPVPSGGRSDGIWKDTVAPFRLHMARFATESAREIYGYDHWVDQVLPLEANDRNPEGWRGNFLVPPRSEADFPYSFAHYAVITDMRFENEVERVLALRGLRVKIRRRDAEKAVIAEAEREGRKVHDSELGLPDEMFDVVIGNSDNNLVEARRKTWHMLHEIEYNGIESIRRGRPLPWKIGY